MLENVSEILRRRKVFFLLTFAGFVLCAFAPPLSAESLSTEPVEEGPLKRNNWTISVVPYLWALSLDGEVTLKGHEADVEMPFGDILEQLNGFLMLDVVVHKGRFGFFVNPLYAKLVGESTGKLLEGTLLERDVKGELTMKMLVMNFGAGYRLGPYALGSRENGRTPAVVVEPYLGGRWTHMDVKIDVTVSETESVEDDLGWADPVIGVMTVWDLYPRWNITLGGDIGGFGVGSDLTWTVICLAGYRFHFSKRIMGNVQFGYRALYQDFETGSGSDQFKYDATMHGPHVAVSIDFGQWFKIK